MACCAAAGAAAGTLEARGGRGARGVLVGLPCALLAHPRVESLLRGANGGRRVRVVLRAAVERVAKVAVQAVEMMRAQTATRRAAIISPAMVTSPRSLRICLPHASGTTASEAKRVSTSVMLRLTVHGATPRAS